MSTPSWLKLLRDSEGEGSFQIPSASLSSAASTLRKHSPATSSTSNIIQGTYENGNCRADDDGIDNIALEEPNISENNGLWNVQPRLNDLNSDSVSANSHTIPRNSFHNENNMSSLNSVPSRSKKKYGTGLSGHEFDNSRSLGRPREARRFDSWSYVDSEGYAWLPPSVHTSVSYGDFEDSSISSGSCMRRDQGHHGVAAERSEKKSRPKRLNKSSSESCISSGYNSHNELSDFSNAGVPYSNSSNSSSHHYNSNNNKNNNRGRESKPNDYSSHDKGDNARYTKYPPRRSSKLPEDRISNTHNKRCDSKLSVAESDFSTSSKDRNNKRSSSAPRGSITSIDQKTPQKVPSLGNVAVTVTNNIQYDPNDPFSFIQPVELPFHAKMRKCLGPVMAVLLLLILAAALGAAIYFASALKDNQENQIDMLRANFAMKIHNIDHIEDIEKLSTTDFRDLSKEYCKNMDIFYTQSQFGKTYRGCEVVSIKNSYINFTLFFVEEAATSSQIVEVIESSATSEPLSQFARVDKFALELDTVQVTMERKLEPETFNKKIIDAQPALESSHKETNQDAPSSENTKKAPRKNQLKTHAPKTTTTTTTKKPPVWKKKTPKDKPVYSWDPCTEYEGMYFPHPTQCDMFIQCTNGQMIEQRCTQGLLYHWKQLTCVSRFTRDVLCPDPSKAPPRPTTVVSTTSTRITTPVPITTTTVKTTTRRGDLYTTMFPSTTKQLVPDGVVLTAIAGKFPERPKYSTNPCEHEVDIQLYPHPDDCAMFIQCVNGEVQNMHCAKGLVFDPTNSACIFPTDHDLLCPDIRPCKQMDDGYFPHPYDCSKFIQCQFKKETVLSCQKDLVWSIKVNSCVHKTKDIKCPLDPK